MDMLTKVYTDAHKRTLVDGVAVEGFVDAHIIEINHDKHYILFGQQQAGFRNKDYNMLHNAEPDRALVDTTTKMYINDFAMIEAIGPANDGERFFVRASNGDSFGLTPTELKTALLA